MLQHSLICIGQHTLTSREEKTVAVGNRDVGTRTGVLSREDEGCQKGGRNHRRKSSDGKVGFVERELSVEKELSGYHSRL